MAAEAARERPTAAVLWILAVCTLTIGSLVAAIALAPAASARPEQGLAWLLFVGSSVHVAATGWLYTVPDIRAHVQQHPRRYIYVPVALICGSAVVAALLPARLDAWALLPYFVWQFFHFFKQNVGMAALAAAGSGVRGLGRSERTALVVAGWAGVAGLISHPALLQLHVNTRVDWVFPLAGAVFAGAAVVGAALLLRRPQGQRPSGYAAVYLSSLLFTIPVFLFRSPYAAVAGMTIAHGLQYLLVVSLVAAGDRRPERRWIGLLLLLNIALLGGAALSVASHLHTGSPAVRLAYGAYLGVVMAHFVIDAGLWRLRDPFPRAFLSERLPYLVRRRPSPAAAAGAELPGGR